MAFVERLENIYVIDTKMRGLDHYHSAYIVKGKEIALIDTGLPSKLEVVRAGIKAHGFSVSDISYIFVTHEHRDHGGNVAALLRESPKASVYMHPIASAFFTKPSSINWDERTSPKILARGDETVESCPPARVKFVNDGDVFDLGDGEKLRISYAPGHQPGGIVIFEEKNNGLFINDLVGNCFMDADSHYPLNPLGSDNVKALESLKKLVDLPIANLYLGHYGITDNPKQVMSRAIKNLEQLLAIGRKYMNEGKPEMIADKVYEMILPELEKLRKVRGEAEYEYAAHQHIPWQAKKFATYCMEKLDKDIHNN